MSKKEKEEIIEFFEASEEKDLSLPKVIPVLPLRDTVIFPYMIFPVLIGRAQTLKAVAEAIEDDKFVFISAQKNKEVENPKFKDIYYDGTIAKIIQVLRLPNNLLKVLVEGLLHARVKKARKRKEYLSAEYRIIPADYDEKDKELKAHVRRVSELFTKYVDRNKNLPSDLISAFENIDDPVRKLYFAASNITQKVNVKQKILNAKNFKRQYFQLAQILTSEVEMLKLEEEIDGKVSDTIQKTQKKFYIQEQIRALQKELGEDEEASPEMAALKKAIKKAKMPKQAREKAEDEFKKLKKTPPMSPEYSVNRTYIEFLTQLPWKEKTDDNLDIQHVKKILDDDHYDLDKPKERILEYIAVLNLVENLKRQILCFVGPPGVGKTSLARSIARALGRRFVRFSLGGIRDEAEIRGHRRTYVGALPGKIIQAMKRAETVNPVILLDEVDKMSMDFRGDPSSALLEVLDPEQNVAFNDHYLEVDYDLSNVLFITTANVRYNIPAPLQDRMEIIELNGYLEPDKIQIAKRHIIPKITEELGLGDFNINFSDNSLVKIIRDYTREAGVRNLEREVSSVLRKLAKEIVQDYDKKRSKTNGKGERVILREDEKFKDNLKKKKFIISDKRVEKYLRAPKYKSKKDKLEDKIGIATGLAWTSAGGDILPVEVAIMSGSEKLTLTGKLGDVMQESAKAALSYIRANAKDLNLPENFYKKKEIHVHAPEGAIPKDGPSAGVTIAMALISAASSKPVKGDVAMTGELTLRGDVLPVGGLDEKLVAAKRLGYKKVLIPEDNLKDVKDVRKDVKDGLEIVALKKLDEAIQHVFRNSAKPSSKSKTKKKTK